MMLKAVNLEEKLSILQRKSESEQLLTAFLESQSLRGPLEVSAERDQPNDFILEKLDPNRIYHINNIKQTCIDYRLRFLGLRYFKNDLPDEAKSAIVKLESDHATKLEDLMIMAPAKMFLLEDKNDPLLMAPLGNGYYYLIHRWGNDLHWARKILAWPLKSLPNMALAILALSVLATLMIPMKMFGPTVEPAHFWIMFMFVFKFIGAIAIFYGFALGKNFSPFVWNSKYFNA